MALSNQTSSGFIRRLNQVSAGIMPRIGFRAQPVEAAPALLVVVTLPGVEPELAEAAALGGADALLVRMNLQDESSDEPVLRSLMKAAGGRPVGVLLAGTPGTSTKRIESWRSAGVDYIVCGIDSGPALLAVSGLGKIVSIDHTVGGELVRSANELPVDAVEAAIAKPDEVGRPMSIRDAMRYRSLSVAVRKPIVVRADVKIAPADVSALRDARVEGLVLDAAETGTDKGSIRASVFEYARAIKALGAAKGRDAQSMRPTIPRIGASVGGVEEPEEEPEEE